MAQIIDFKIGSVNTRALVSLPEGTGPFPGVIVAFHREGIDRFTEWVCDDLAKNGYAAITPDHYHILPPGVGPDRRREFMTDEQVALDFQAAADWLVSDAKVDGNRIGILGHCMGGRNTLVGLVALPELFRCGCDWYGGNAFGQLGKVPPPADRLAAIKAPLMGFFGNDDTSPSPDDVDRLDRILTELGKWHEFHRYDGTGHAFMGASREKHREKASYDSWGRALKFLNKHLGGRVPETVEIFPAAELV